MKVPNPPGSGKGIAEGKGVRREAESEGSRMWEQTNHGQTSGLTNRNHILRLRMRVRLHSKPKPNSYTESCVIDVTGRWREGNVWYPGRSAWNAPKGVTAVIQGKPH